MDCLCLFCYLRKLRKQKMKVAMEESYKNRSNAKDFVLLDNYMCEYAGSVSWEIMCVYVCREQKVFNPMSRVLSFYNCLCVCVQVCQSLVSKNKNILQCQGFYVFQNCFQICVCLTLCVLKYYIHIVFGYCNHIKTGLYKNNFEVLNY